MWNKVVIWPLTLLKLSFSLLFYFEYKISYFHTQKDIMVDITHLFNMHACQEF